MTALQDFTIFKMHSFIHSFIDYIIFLLQLGFLFLKYQIIFKCLFQHYQLVLLQLFCGYQVLAQKHSFWASLSRCVEITTPGFPTSVHFCNQNSSFWLQTLGVGSWQPQSIQIKTGCHINNSKLGGLLHCSNQSFVLYLFKNLKIAIATAY